MYCHKCDTDLIGKKPYVQVTGYIKHRPEGGTNQILLREKTGRLLCESCIALLRGSHHSQQMGLPE